MKKKTLDIQNISCANCISKIGRILVKKGAKCVDGNVLMKKIRVIYNTNKLTTKSIKNILEKNGYLLTTNSTLYKKLFITSLFLYILYLTTNYLYSNIYIAYIISILNLIIIIIKLKQKFYNIIDELMILGSLSSFLLAIISFIFEYDDFYEDYSISIYFLDISMLILLFLLLKEYILEFVKNRQSKFIERFENKDFTATKLIKACNNRYILTDIDKIQQGDIILLKEDNFISIDGTVIKGEGFIDESNITGESAPKKITDNDKIFSGSKIISGNLLCRVENTGKKSLIGKLLSNIKKTTYPKEEFKSFHKIIIFISIVSTLFYFILGTIGIKPTALYINDSIIISSIKIGLTVLTVSCPCALIISKPLLILTATNSLLKYGIIIRNYNSLLLENVDIIFFDKTGTLTNNNYNILKEYNINNIDNKLIYGLLNTIENEEIHPIGKFLYNYTYNYKIDAVIRNKKRYTGKGIEAHIIFNNKDYNIKIGNKDYILNTFNSCNSNDVNNHSKDNIYNNKNINITTNKELYISINNNLEYIIELRETLKKSTVSTINKLKNNKIKVIMITGDNKSNSKKIAKTLKIKYHSNKSSRQKVKTIKKYIKNLSTYENPSNESKQSLITRIYNYYSKIYSELYPTNIMPITIMIGDGYNDIPAMKTTTTSISINNFHSKSDIIVLATKNNTDNINYIIKYINTLKDINRKSANNNKFFYIYNIIIIAIAIGTLLPFNIYINIKASVTCMFLSFIFILYNSTL